ncbi:hypothetical protein HanIR_Chr10g0462811 [Helianthus annuus]|nr:hypothetical protein HanIR_Chr10g0462811 [Helianthus annuus]
MGGYMWLSMFSFTCVISEPKRVLFLYVHEGIDLTGNNKNKKDKKAFKKVLKLADKIRLTKKEISKHDLSMFAYNRPH